MFTILCALLVNWIALVFLHSFPSAPISVSREIAEGKIKSQKNSLFIFHSLFRCEESFDCDRAVYSRRNSASRSLALHRPRIRFLSPPLSFHYTESLIFFSRVQAIFVKPTFSTSLRSFLFWVTETTNSNFCTSWVFLSLLGYDNATATMMAQQVLEFETGNEKFTWIKGVLMTNVTSQAWPTFLFLVPRCSIPLSRISEQLFSSLLPCCLVAVLQL